MLAIFRFIAVLSCVASIGLGQDEITSKVTHDPVAESFLQRSLSAMGAKTDPMNQVATVTGTLKLLGDDEIDFPVVIKSQGNTLMRTELSTKQGVRVFVINNGRGVIQYPDGKSRVLNEENTILQRASHVPVLGILSDGNNPNVNVQYEGRSVFNNKSVDSVAVSSFKGKTDEEIAQNIDRTKLHLFLNTDTGLLEGMSYLNYSENDPTFVQTFQVIYSNYQSIQGFMVPLQQDTFADGKPFLSLTISTIAFDGSVADSDFNLAGAK